MISEKPLSKIKNNIHSDTVHYYPLHFKIPNELFSIIHKNVHEDWVKFNSQMDCYSNMNNIQIIN